MIVDAKPTDMGDMCGVEEQDRAVVLAEIWCDAHARALALCRRQQRLESRIARKMDFPPFPSRDDCSGSVRWDEVDRELGYSRTKNAEERAAQTAEQLLEQLARTPAQSIAGVIAKLEAVLLESEVSDSPSGFPWPHLRSILADLKRLAPPGQPSPMARP